MLSVKLFDGVSALRVGLDVLGIPVASHISVERSPEARRVGVVAIGSGAPCQGVSGLTVIGTPIKLRVNLGTSTLVESVLPTDHACLGSCGNCRPKRRKRFQSPDALPTFHH